MSPRLSCVVAVIATLTLAGCGSAASSTRASTPASTCADAGTDATTRVLASPDLDADGEPDELREVTSGQCRGTLLALLDGAVHEVAASEGPSPGAAYGVVLGNGTVLLATRQVHPRGGFQVRLHAATDGRYVELTGASGEPVVPFVATDTVPGTPVVATCTEDGVRVLTASPTAGPGWRVSETTYRVLDGRAVELASREVRESAVVPLAARHPDLAERAIFPECRTDR